MAIKTQVSNHQLKRLISKFSEGETLPANPKHKPRKRKKLQQGKSSGNVQSVMAKASSRQKVAENTAEKNRQEYLAKKAAADAKKGESNESK